MALEITEMSYEQGGPKKSAPQDKGTPKKSAPQKGKLLSSMKKKYLNGVEVMDTELRENVPVSQVRKEGAEFVRAMDKSRIMSEKLNAEKEKAKTAPLKAAGGPRFRLESSKSYGPAKSAIGPKPTLKAPRAKM